MDERPDATLVADALAGRREAFATLVRRYQDYAYGLAIGRLADFELARDVVQEAFLCAYRDLRKLRDPARFAGWLRGIVRNTAHRALRELDQMRCLANELKHDDGLASYEPAPDHVAETQERRALVRRALEQLNEKNREAVSLFYVNGLSYADIAGFLGVSSAAVQGRLQRGRAQLRKELAMVEETFKEQELPDDFTDEIRRLLSAAAVRGEEHERAIQRLAEIGAPAVDPLCDALGDPRLPVRRAAAQALCRIGDPRVLRTILNLLPAETAWKQEVWGSGRALSIPGMREALLGVLGKGKPVVQGCAMAALSHLGDDDEVFARILEVFRDPGTHTGLLHSALTALCRMRTQMALDFVVEALRRDDLRLRGYAAWVAVWRGLRPPMEDCVGCFVEGVNWWGRVCAGRLVLEHGPAGRRELERILQSGSPVARCTAAIALARAGHAEAFGVLLDGLLGERRDRNWAKAISRALAAHCSERLRARAERDPDGFLGMPAILWTLARSRPGVAGPMVEVLSRTGTPAARAAAVRILTRQRAAEFIPDLRRCLREGRPRKMAQEAFRQMQRLGEAAMPTVQQMLVSDHWTERKAAYCLLRRWDKLTAELRQRGQADAHVAVRDAALGCQR